jgi:beta-lactamase class A
VTSLCGLVLALAAAPPEREDPQLRAALASVLREARRRFPLERAAAALIDLRDGRRASVHGGRPFYAASVVKIAFAVGLYDAVRTGRVRIDAPVRADLARMLGPSDNEAANRILDLACGTAPGPALRGAELREFVRRRGCIDRRVHRRGMAASRAGHKLSFASPRDRQLYRFRRHNQVTANDVARLLVLLRGGEAVTPDVDREILGMMEREAGRGHPIHAPFARGVPAGVRVWSKAGWTRRWAHDAAIVEGAGGLAYVLVVLTRQARPAGHLAWVAGRIHRLLARH